MDLDYAGYMDATIDLLAFHNWQYLFCPINFNDTVDLEYCGKKIKNSLDVLVELFPEKDFSPYFQRWEDRS